MRKRIERAVTESLTNFLAVCAVAMCVIASFFVPICAFGYFFMEDESTYGFLMAVGATIVGWSSIGGIVGFVYGLISEDQDA